jgi:hypothetical protein
MPSNSQYADNQLIRPRAQYIGPVFRSSNEQPKQMECPDRAITDLVAWDSSEPRLARNRAVVL